MTQQDPRGTPRPTALRQFLLGLSPTAEAERLEGAVLEDDDYFGQLTAAEDDLIDDYALGRLSKRERVHFEEHFARGGGEARHERLRQRVRFARDLSTHGSQQARASRGGFSLRRFLSSLASLLAPPMRPVLATAMAAMIVLVGFSAWQAVALRSQLDQEQETVAAGLEQIELLRAQAHTARQGDPRLAEELAAARQQLADLESRGAQLRTELDEARQAIAARGTASPIATVARSASFVLSMATSVRGVEAAQRLRIPAGIDHVDLQVDLTGDTGFESYRLALRTIAGDEIWSRAGLKLQAPSWGSGVELRLPAASLVPGNYELMVFGNSAGELEELAFIDFRVDRADS